MAKFNPYNYRIKSSSTKQFYIKDPNGPGEFSITVRPLLPAQLLAVWGRGDQCARDIASGAITLLPVDNRVVKPDANLCQLYVALEEGQIPDKPENKYTWQELACIAFHPWAFVTVTEAAAFAMESDQSNEEGGSAVPLELSLEGISLRRAVPSDIFIQN